MINSVADASAKNDDDDGAGDSSIAIGVVVSGALICLCCLIVACVYVRIRKRKTTVHIEVGDAEDEEEKDEEVHMTELNPAYNLPAPRQSSVPFPSSNRFTITSLFQLGKSTRDGGSRAGVNDNQIRGSRAEGVGGNDLLESDSDDPIGDSFYDQGPGPNTKGEMTTTDEVQTAVDTDYNKSN